MLTYVAQEDVKIMLVIISVIVLKVMSSLKERVSVSELVKQIIDGDSNKDDDDDDNDDDDDDNDDDGVDIICTIDVININITRPFFCCCRTI